MTPELLKQLNEVRWEAIGLVHDLWKAADATAQEHAWEALGEALIRMAAMSATLRAIRVML